MPSITAKLRAVIAGALLSALIVPAAAHASGTQLSLMQDDDLLVYRDDATRDATLRQMKGLGVDAVRVTVLWSVVTDGLDGKPKNKKQKAQMKADKKRFNHYGESNPKAYPKLNWDRYDRLARACKTLGIICYFDVTGPGPSWSHGKVPSKYRKDAKWWKPNPRHFYRFVQAVGKRYSGSYRDENDGRVTIPRVGFWSLWNEPNQGGWLRPQYQGGKPMSPSIFRQLYIFGHRALESTGHGGDVILLGETAPTGSGRTTTTSAMGPKQFISELLCAPGTSQRGCNDFAKYGPLKASAYAHHPYTKDLPPTQVDTQHADSITMANFNDLGTLLDQISQQTGNIAPGMKLISTEFGYETNPPDVFAHTNLAQQAQYDQIGDYLTFLNPRVIGNTQFLLRDVKPNKKHAVNSKAYWSTYQSGLYTAGGTAKPAAQAYAFPFLVYNNNDITPQNTPAVDFWGQLRFLRAIPPDGSQTVLMQFKPADGSADWAQYGDRIPVTDPNGYFIAQLPKPPVPGFFRAIWQGNESPQFAVTLPQPVG